MRTNNWLLQLKRIALITLLCFSVSTVASAQTRRVLTMPDIDSTTTEATQGVGRRSDPLWNGALIGAGVAVASGLFLCTRMEPWRNCNDDVGPMLGIGAIGAGIGIAIDALIRKRAPSNDTQGKARLYAAPIVGREARGMRMAITF
jgi:hypothetical protein